METDRAALPPLRSPVWRPLSEYPVSPGLLVFDSFRPRPPGFSSGALSPDLTLPLSLAFPLHQLQPFHPQAKLGRASSPWEPSRASPTIPTQHSMQPQARGATQSSASRAGPGRGNGDFGHESVVGCEAGPCTGERELRHILMQRPVSADAPSNNSSSRDSQTSGTCCDPRTLLLAVLPLGAVSVRSPHPGLPRSS